MDSASRTCFCSVECAWTLRFRQQAAAVAAARAAAAQRVAAAQAAAAAPAHRDTRGHHADHGAFAAAATDKVGGGHGAGLDATDPAYADPYHGNGGVDDCDEEARGAALQQTAALLRGTGLGRDMRFFNAATMGGAVDSESDSSGSPGWDRDDMCHHAMFDWQALDKDNPFGSLSSRHYR